MAQLHLVLAWFTTAAALATLVVAGAGIVVDTRIRLLLDRLILATVAALLLAALAGLPLALLSGLPSDALHLVYGAVAPLILLGGRYLGRRGSIRRRSAFVALASVAVLGVVYRLFTTGGA